MTWPASIPTIGAGGFATSAEFNDFRDALKAIGDPLTPYSPALTGASSDPTLGSSSLTGRYRRLGKWVDYQIELTIGSGWAAGSGNYRFTIPPYVPINSFTGKVLGTAVARDASSAGTRAFVAYQVSSTTLSLLETSVAVVGPGAPFTWATGDTISIDGHYEIN